MSFQNFFSHPMTIGTLIGLGIGFFFWCWMFIAWWKKGRQVNRYLKMLDDKAKMEKEHLDLYRQDKTRLEEEKQKLADQNDNLREKVNQMKKTGGSATARDLEIFARAEQKLQESSSTFLIAWEDAKTSAAKELDEEEQGSRKSESFFRRFIPKRNGSVAATS